MSENILEIRHLGKSFGTHEVLRDIDFTVKKGDVISIIGASGSGKSTLLRCVNLLETPSSGQILYHGTDVAGRGGNAPRGRPPGASTPRSTAPMWVWCSSPSTCSTICRSSKTAWWAR